MITKRTKTTGFNLILSLLFVPCFSYARTVGEWSNEVYDWAQIVIIPVCTAIFLFAGVVYMTSGGNPSRVSLAKKLITGAVSALLVLFIGRWFIKVILGVDV